jgi:hypothetical protein
MTQMCLPACIKGGGCARFGWVFVTLGVHLHQVVLDVLEL